MSTPKSQPSRGFIDAQMKPTVLAFIRIEYLSRRPGSEPSDEEVRSFAARLGDAELLRLVRGYPGHGSLQEQLREDADVLRWARKP